VIWEFRRRRISPKLYFLCTYFMGGSPHARLITYSTLHSLLRNLTKPTMKPQPPALSPRTYNPQPAQNRSVHICPRFHKTLVYRSSTCASASRARSSRAASPTSVHMHTRHAAFGNHSLVGAASLDSERKAATHQPLRLLGSSRGACITKRADSYPRKR
jgi:hypothetical protein